MRAPLAIKKILVVCAGNICRSPMAEALFRQRIDERSLLDQIMISSAGTIAIEGNLPCDEVVALMRTDHGVDISGHRAQSFTIAIPADLILTMDQQITNEVRATGSSVPVEMLGDYVGTSEEVDDPYGGPASGYRRSLRILDRLVTKAVDRILGETTCG